MYIINGSEWFIDFCLALAALQLSLTNLPNELNCLRGKFLSHWPGLKAVPCLNGPADVPTWCILQLTCTLPLRVLIAISANLSDTHNKYGLCYVCWLEIACYILLYYTQENILFMNSGRSLALNNGTDLHIKWQGNAVASECLHWQNA